MTAKMLYTEKNLILVKSVLLNCNTGKKSGLK